MDGGVPSRGKLPVGAGKAEMLDGGQGPLPPRSIPATISFGRSGAGALPHPGAPLKHHPTSAAPPDLQLRRRPPQTRV